MPSSEQRIRNRNSSADHQNRAANWRWGVIIIFVFMNVVNFFDRGLLSANAPNVKGEFHLSNTQFGEMISAFSFIYALIAPFAGALLDRFGLTRTTAGAVLVWSLGSAATGITSTFRGLLLSRVVLGFGEAAALPCLGKAAALYLPPSEWGLANAVGSITVTLGITLAPLMAAFMSPKFGWRSTFLLSGALGIIWIVLWLGTSRLIPCRVELGTLERFRIKTMLGDRRLLGTALSYALVMVLYMFWLNWTTIYLVQARHFSATDANRYFAWIPPLLAVFGGFLSGGLAFRWIRAGMDPVSARIRVCWMSAPVTLVTAAIPWLASTPLAVFAIGLTLLFCMSVITSLNVIPVDLFGPRNAGFTTAVLACSYALMQAFVSPLIGKAIDYTGFDNLCILLSVFPLLAIGLLRLVIRPGSRILGAAGGA